MVGFVSESGPIHTAAVKLMTQLENWVRTSRKEENWTGEVTLMGFQGDESDV